MRFNGISLDIGDSLGFFIGIFPGIMDCIGAFMKISWDFMGTTWE